MMKKKPSKMEWTLQEKEGSVREEEGSSNSKAKTSWEVIWLVGDSLSDLYERC